MNKSAASTTNVEQAKKYAEEALTLMGEHNIAAIPRNFAVWYEYVSKGNPSLTKEIDAQIETKKPFSEALNDHLHFEHIATQSNDMVEQATDDVQAMLNAALQAIQSFSGDAASAEKEMSASLDALDGSAAGDVNTLIKQLVDSATSLKDGSSNLSSKLEESRQEIDQLKEKLDMAKKESEQDFLTGLFNRKALDKRIASLAEESKDTNQPLSIMMIDIDHFKKFNDTYGHQIGDQVLKIVAKALKDSLKGSDIVARYGGEEFSVLLPETPLVGATAAAEAVRKNIASKELKRRDTGENYGQITVSIGVACFKLDSDDPKTFVKRADDALYKSKQDGRNRVTMEP
ncbi:MAG: GGDEF domain-containing protein [Rickettsiales bacterium]|nr:GGDEF domain-containing protein [Rickettsiales bacterium]